MRTLKKIILSILAVVFLCAAAYLTYYIIHYTKYDGYKQYLGKYDDYEDGNEYVAQSDADAPEGFGKAAENDTFKLFLNETTCNVCLFCKSTRQYIYTNPPKLGEKSQEGINSDDLYQELQSQILVDYFDFNATSKNTYRMSSAKDCVNIDTSENGGEQQFSFESLTNGLRVIYEMGDKSSETGMVPKYLSEERYNEILDRLNQLEDKSHYRSMKGKYSKNEERGCMELLKNNINKATLRKLTKALNEIGYTQDDYINDMKVGGEEVVEKLTITVPLEYRLTEDGLQVSVVTEKIRERGGAGVETITVLPFFDTEKNDGSDGYFVVPDGSGALIRFNNGLMNSKDYYQEYYYGMDLLSIPDKLSESMLDIEEPVRLPIYGIQKSSNTVLVTTDFSAPIAYLTVKLSGAFNNYNFAYNTYILRNYETMKIDANEFKEYEDDICKTKLVQTYHVLPETEVYDGYSGIAKYYRELLFDSKTPKNSAQDIKFYADIINAVERESSFAGFKYDEVFAMTTFEETAEIRDSLDEAGVRNIVLNLQGWMNHGYYHDTADNIKVIRKLGGRNGLEKLTASTQAKNGTVVGDIAVQKVSFADEDFKYTAEGARYRTTGSVAFGKSNPATYSNFASLGYRENLYNLLSPKFVPRYVEEMLDELEDVTLSGISLRDLGSELYSERKRRSPISRVDAENILTAMIRKVSEQNDSVLYNNPNAYAYPYATDIENLSFYKNAYVYVNEEIPLIPMILHGYVDYCGKAYNQNTNESLEDEWIQLILNGAAPHFSFTMKDSSELKYTALNDHFSTTFSVWKEDAVKLYQNVNKVLRDVAGETIEKHEMPDSDTVVMVYGNGIVITVHKESKKVTKDDHGAVTEYRFE